MPGPAGAPAVESCPDPASHEGPHPDPSQPGSIPVDHYELTCGCGEHQRTVYMDMYHPTPSGAGSTDADPGSQGSEAALEPKPGGAEGNEEQRLGQPGQPRAVVEAQFDPPLRPRMG